MDNSKLLEITKKHSGALKNEIVNFDKNFLVDGNINHDKNLENVKEKAYIAILFIGICIERCRSNITDRTEIDYAKGFTFIYNVLKHSSSPFDIEFLNYRKSGFIGKAAIGIARIGMGPTLEWNKLPLDNSVRNGHQSSQFDKHLLNTEISPSIDKIINIIENHL